MPSTLDPSRRITKVTDLQKTQTRLLELTFELDNGDTYALPIQSPIYISGDWYVSRRPDVHGLSEVDAVAQRIIDRKIIKVDGHLAVKHIRTTITTVQTQVTEYS